MSECPKCGCKEYTFITTERREMDFYFGESPDGMGDNGALVNSNGFAKCVQCGRLFKEETIYEMARNQHNDH